VDDVVEIISRLLQKPAIADINFDKNNPVPATSWAPHMIFNIGNNKPITLKKFIQTLEKELNKEAIKEFQDIQKGDVVGTHCNNTLISNWIGYRPKTLLDNGIKEFISWYKSYYHH
jgi:UDP-glucuronate 4-epimerase